MSNVKTTTNGFRSIPLITFQYFILINLHFYSDFLQSTTWTIFPTDPSHSFLENAVKVPKLEEI